MSHNDRHRASQPGESIPLLAPDEESSDMAARDHELKNQTEAPIEVDEDYNEEYSTPQPTPRASVLAQSEEVKSPVDVEAGSKDAESHTDSSPQTTVAEEERNGSEEPVVYRVYKIRWFGLFQLVLLNIIVSWDWLSFSPVADTAATFFSTNTSVINWLSTAFLFAFVVAAPGTIYTLYSGGPRRALITASLLILLGNWIRYGGVRSHPPRFGVVMFGQILTGLAQPLVLCAPTRFSDEWFSPRGRVSATAIASLANPFGGALGQLINPFLCSKPEQIPNMTLYVAIISSVATIPTMFLPSKPPTPVAPSSAGPRPTLKETLRLCTHNTNFWLLVIPFAALVGLFNCLSSILEQVLSPYGFSESDAGIAGALLIIIGLVTAAVTSPIVDRTKKYLLLIKVFVPIIAICNLAFIWAPGSRTVAAPFVILSVYGAAAFSVVPVGLEWMVEITYPGGPETSSTLCWVGGQLLGAIFIIISNALKAGEHGNPPYNMGRALIFQAVIALAATVPTMLLGVIGAKSFGRLGVDRQASITR